MELETAASIGRRIAQARKEAGGLTQAELAEHVGVSKRAVQTWELGTTIPWRHFPTISETTGKPLAWFLHGDEWTIAASGEIADVLRELRDLVSAIADRYEEDRQTNSRLEHEKHAAEALQRLAAQGSVLEQISEGISANTEALTKLAAAIAA